MIGAVLPTVLSAITPVATPPPESVTVTVAVPDDEYAAGASMETASVEPPPAMVQPPGWTDHA